MTKSISLEIYYTAVFGRIFLLEKFILNANFIMMAAFGKLLISLIVTGTSKTLSWTKKTFKS